VGKHPSVKLRSDKPDSRSTRVIRTADDGVHHLRYADDLSRCKSQNIASADILPPLLKLFPEAVTPCQGRFCRCS
jgi:hypothetical protein